MGTSCALESIRLFIEQKKLNRSNYLLIGLFCDKSMTYQIWNYYASKYSDLKEMYFRSKDGGGWPGSFCIRVNEENILLNKKERMRFKDYFCHERCLYCTDKLNMNADISLGDNYTGKNDSIFGTSSIIIRSFQGKAAFEFIRKDCALYEIDMETIARSQELGKKKENGIFSQIKFGSEKQTSIRMYIKYCYKRLKIWSGYYAIKYPWIMKLLQAIKS